MGVLYRELGALYAAFARGEPDPLPPLPVQYADYAAWQRRWVEGEVLEAQAEYWTRDAGRRAGAAGAARPTIRARRGRTSPGRVAGRGAGRGADRGAEGAGQRHGTTLFMTLLAGWAAVLARLSGQDDVVRRHAHRPNRGRREIEGLIGFFVNTLALRVDLSGAPTVAEAAGARAGAGAGGAAAPGHPLRAGGGAGAAGAEPGAQPALPGDVHLAERAARAAGAAGAEPGRAADAGAAHARPSSTCRWRSGRTAGGSPGAVEYATALFERGDGGALAGLPAPRAGGDGRGRRPRRRRVCRCCRRASAAQVLRGVERDGGGVPARGVRPRAVRSAGGAHARRGGGGRSRASS